MSKYLVETFYTCTFKIIHKLDELNEKKLTELENRKDGEVQIIISGDYIAGFIINAFTSIEDPNIKEKLIYYYIKESYGNLTTKIESLDWIGRAHWETNENEFYYSKKLIRKKKIVEELIITNEEMGRAF